MTVLGDMMVVGGSGGASSAQIVGIVQRATASFTGQTSSTLNTIIGAIPFAAESLSSMDIVFQAFGEAAGTATGELDLYDLTALTLITTLVLPNGTFAVTSEVLSLADATHNYELRLRRVGGAEGDVVTVSWAGLSFS